jgi:acyl carrier protein
LYGPTEYTTYTTWCEVVAGAGAVLIGRPVANTRVYILDGELEPVPIGVSGEIYIAGAGLARGYLRRPELTAEKFVPNPFGEAGSRLYRTGDLGRYLKDGTIEFLGRLDHQVKVRGYRIELGEVEATLLSHPAVRECVAAAAPGPAGDPRLVAYVVPGGAADPAAWRSHLKERLPDYMVPSLFVEVGALPRTPNGKVDRGALPAPVGRDSGAGEYVAPRGAVEEAIAEAWREVLGLERVGVHDDFFALGGHSLVLMQVISRIHAILGVELSVRSFFDHPTVSELAQATETLRWLGAGPLESTGGVRQRTVGEV